MDAVHNTRGPTPFSHSRARSLRTLELPGARLSQYVNAYEHVYYEDNRVHTFSLYLEGGYETRRTDTHARHGEPGRFCLMPAGSYSAWDVGVRQEFIHVYFDDAYIKRLAMQNFDVDPRLVSLPHLTFERSESINALVRHSLYNVNWQQIDNRMLLQHSLQNILLHLLQAVGVKRVNSGATLKSGLSPSVQKRLEAYIDAHYHRQITLAELAKVAELSEYHLARMFKLSFADTPQNYISQYRVQQLQRRLKQRSAMERPDMAQLALDYGFSSQSHMGRVFKKRTGVTPGQFMKMI